jgi:2-polyprenyl-3-methyl-5-hydroxy-6-metoxy-1,4-benzoquinol methylase
VKIVTRIAGELRRPRANHDADFYDSPDVLAAYVGSVGEGLWPVEARIADRFVRRGDRVLDVGCGVGREALGFASRGARVVGIDRSGRAVDVARKNVQDARFEAVSFEDFAAQPGSFDLVFFASDVVASIPGRENRIAMLDRAAALGAIVAFQAELRRGAKRIALDAVRVALAKLGVDVPEPGDRCTPTYRHLFTSERALDRELAAASLRREARIDSYVVARAIR